MRHFVESVPDELGYLYATPEAIDREGRTIDAELCNRVYMCGLAKTQTAYEESLRRVFAELDRIEDILSDGRLFLMGGENLSLVDIQLVACLVRFDPVYFDLFKCFARRISSYKFVSTYLRRATQTIGAEAMSLDLDQIVHHYYSTFTSANPKGIIPIGYHKDFLDGGKESYVTHRMFQRSIRKGERNKIKPTPKNVDPRASLCGEYRPFGTGWAARIFRWRKTDTSSL